MTKMNKKAEGGSSGGIGFFGVFMAILLFFVMRGCMIENHQEGINEFCIEEGFDYGEETIRNTIIECNSFEGNITKIPYNIYLKYMNVTDR